MEDIDRILKANKALNANDSDWFSYYQELASFCLPRKANINSIKITGSRLNFNFLYDVRAIRAAKEAAGGFFSYLSNPSTRWFATESLDKRLMQSGAVQRYYKEVDDIKFSIIGQSNFYDSILEYNADYVVFGTANMLTLEDELDHVRYTPVPVEQYSFEEDSRGRPCGVYRNFPYTASQCWDRWGDKCSPKIKEAIAQGKYYDNFEILHYVGPRKRRDIYKEDRFSMAWASVWIVKAEDHRLEESGFIEFPYAISRFWKDTISARGYSPAMDVLAAIKLLNAEKRTDIRARMKAADPATMMPSRGWLARLNMNPNAINYYDKTKTGPADLQVLESKARFDATIDAMNAERAEIEAGFFIPLFRALSDDKRQKTALEVQRLIAENMYLLAPVVMKLQKEGLTPMHERTHYILERRGMFPEPPEELRNVPSEMVYLSPLAKAAKASEMTGIDAYLQTIAAIKDLVPTITDNLNGDRIAHVIREVQSVDPTILFDKKIVKNIRARREQLDQALQKLQLAGAGSQIAETVSKTNKNNREVAAQ